MHNPTARPLARTAEPTRSNATLYAPLALLAVLAVVLLALGLPGAGALVAGLGFLYAVAWFAAAASLQ